MDKKVVQTPLMKMLNPLYHFKTKEEEERDFQAIRMYKLEEGSTVCKTENLVGTDVFLIEDQIREDDLKFQNEQKSPVSKASIKDKFSKPYRRDVEVIRVLKRMHIERETTKWKKKLNSSSITTNNSKFIKTVEGFHPTEQGAGDFVDWAYQDSLRNAKTTRNFIMATADKLKAYEKKVSQTFLPIVPTKKQQHSMSSTSKLSSSMGQQSSKSLFSSPASLISGKSLSEKLDRLEKQLKKKEQLRNKIDSSMYNFQHKSSRLNPKNARQSQCASRNSAAARSSIVASRRNSVIGRNSNGGGGTTTSSRSDLSQHPEEGAAGSVPLPPSSSPSPLYSPKPPPGKRPVATSSPPPVRKHRHLSVSKTKSGVQATDTAEHHSAQITKSESFGSNEASSTYVSPKVEATRKHINHADSNSSIHLSQTSLLPNDASPSAEKKEKKKNNPGTTFQKPKLESMQSTVAQNSFAEKVKRDNKNEHIEVLPTVQYFSSPNKLCETTPSELLVLNGNILDDPTKKYFHPVQKNDKSKAVKKKSNYVADIMRIGLSNKEINEREKQLIAQKKKLGIPKHGYIEGIRSKNNKNLFRIQKDTILRRQNLNRRTNEFNAVKRETTQKGVEAAQRKELCRPSLRMARLDDLTVEDAMWQSKVFTEEEKQNSLFGGQSSVLSSHCNDKLDDVSQVSDFNHHVRQSVGKSSKPEQPSLTGSSSPRPAVITRKDSQSVKEELQLLLTKKVLETTRQDMQSTVFEAHSKMTPSSHGEVSPRAGHLSFLENQSRMEEVAESKQIQYLEENKWIILVIALVKGLATKRKAMSSEERNKSPTTPTEVFLFIACLLRIILVGATISKETFYLLVQKVFSKLDHGNVVSNQVITLVRTCLHISPQEYCDFLLSIGIQPPERLVIQIKNAKKKKRIFAKVRVAGAMANAMKQARKLTVRKRVNNQMVLKRTLSTQSQEGSMDDGDSEYNEKFFSENESFDLFDSPTSTPRKNTTIKLNNHLADI